MVILCNAGGRGARVGDEAGPWPPRSRHHRRWTALPHGRYNPKTGRRGYHARMTLEATSRTFPSASASCALTVGSFTAPLKSSTKRMLRSYQSHACCGYGRSQPSAPLSRHCSLRRRRLRRCASRRDEQPPACFGLRGNLVVRFPTRQGSSRSPICRMKSEVAELLLLRLLHRQLGLNLLPGSFVLTLKVSRNLPLQPLFPHCSFKCRALAPNRHNAMLSR